MRKGRAPFCVGSKPKKPTGPDDVSPHLLKNSAPGASCPSHHSLHCLPCGKHTGLQRVKEARVDALEDGQGHSIVVALDKRVLDRSVARRPSRKNSEQKASRVTSCCSWGLPAGKNPPGRRLTGRPLSPCQLEASVPQGLCAWAVCGASTGRSSLFFLQQLPAVLGLRDDCTLSCPTRDMKWACC
ncbi:hypothetical protein GWK47_054657 [Chionoecetes opilio]|uniref:Uncharacterized protein n=1 Tax=Chionoecetes opilio TaxID=41210 RepID=A0A8J5C791_CHIOP|nr:hypothetical protein GWK47_054657 [Chionoecetes opilio]